MMNRLGLLTCLFLLVATAAWAQQSSAERVDPERLRPRLPKRIAYSAPGMERIKARKDVVWKRVDGLSSMTTTARAKSSGGQSNSSAPGTDA
jgi:hypothetical protein